MPMRTFPEPYVAITIQPGSARFLQAERSCEHPSRMNEPASSSANPEATSVGEIRSNPPIPTDIPPP
jgi:hypothetical protein